MRYKLAVTSFSLLLAACGTGLAPEGSEEAPAPARPGLRVLGSFEGVLDAETGEVAFRAPDGTLSPTALVAVPEGLAGVTLSTSNVSSTASNCGGASFEGDIQVTNHGAALDNVYVEITSIALSGREGCNSDAIPLPGSSAVSAANGLWAYGNLATNASATRRWQFARPSSTPYAFHGRVVTSGTLSSHGAGSGWGTTIDDLLLDSDGANLYVTVKFSNPPDTSNHLYLLVDDARITSGMGLKLDWSGWGALSAPAGLVANSAGVDFDYAQAVVFSASGDGAMTATGTPHVTILANNATSTAGSPASTQDKAAGRYNFAIPYSTIGSGGAFGGDSVRVYALYGKDNQFNNGIHSAAPAQPQAQIDLMNVAGGHGLDDFVTVAPAYTLAGTPPTVAVTRPYAGAKACAWELLKAYAGNGATAKVTYSIDGVPLATATSSPWTVTWDSTSSTNGAHSITAAAYDAGNALLGTSAGVSVTVGNGDSSRGACRSVHLTMGMPDLVSTTSTSNTDHFLVQSRRQYASSQNGGLLNPNWDAWELNKSWTDVGRSGTWGTDPLVPLALQATDAGYKYSGYDRGHMCPSADRNTTAADNDVTFQFTNAVPQAPANNQGPWEKLETYLRTVLGDKEVFLISGPLWEWQSGIPSTTSTPQVPIPSATWKIAVLLDRVGMGPQDITTSTRVIAVIVPNCCVASPPGGACSPAPIYQAGCPSDLTLLRADNWYARISAGGAFKYCTTVRAIELRTGLNFLSEVAQDIQDVVENQVDSDCLNAP